MLAHDVCEWFHVLANADSYDDETEASCCQQTQVSSRCQHSKPIFCTKDSIVLSFDMSTTNSMLTDPIDDWTQYPIGPFDSDVDISFTFDNEGHSESGPVPMTDMAGWDGLAVPWDLFGVDSLHNSVNNIAVEPPVVVEASNGAIEAHAAIEAVEARDEDDDRSVDTPLLTPKTTLKRAFLPSNENYFDRQTLRDALIVVKKLRTGSLCDYRGCVRSLTKSFNDTYTTPCTLCLPPLPESLAAVREKLRVSQVRVVNSTGSTIVVKEMKSLKPGKEQARFTFLFQNGEWVCGDKVLFFSAV